MNHKFALAAGGSVGLAAAARCQQWLLQGAILSLTH